MGGQPLRLRTFPMASEVVVDWNVRFHDTFYGSTGDALHVVWPIWHARDALFTRLHIALWPIWHVRNVSPNSCTMDNPYTVLRATLQHVCTTGTSNAERDLPIAICTITLPNRRGDPSNSEGTRKTNA